MSRLEGAPGSYNKDVDSDCSALLATHDLKSD